MLDFPNVYVHFVRVKKDLSDLKGFLWIHLRHVGIVKEMKNYMKQLRLLHLALGYKSERSVLHR